MQHAANAPFILFWMLITLKHRKLSREDMLSLFAERGSFEACSLALGTSTSNFRKMWWEVVGSKPISKPLSTTLLQEAVFPLELDGPPYQVGCVSDPHLTSVHQQPTALDAFYDECHSRDIHNVFLAGDLIEGTGNYRGMAFQTFVNGKEAVADYFAAHYPRVEGITTLYIGGNHDQSVHSKYSWDVCSAIAHKRSDMFFRGYRSATFLVNGGAIRLTMHHGAGAASQVRANQSDILLLGHYHVYKIVEDFHGAYCLQLPAFHAMAPAIGGVILTFGKGKPVIEFLQYDRIIDDY